MGMHINPLSFDGRVMKCSPIYRSSCKPRDEGFGGVGYTETRLDGGSYKLSYYESSFDNKDDVMDKWKKRSSELCGVEKFQSDVTNKNWTYDNYSLIPSLVFKTQGSSPLVEGKLVCE